MSYTVLKKINCHTFVVQINEWISMYTLNFSHNNFKIFHFDKILLRYFELFWAIQKGSSNTYIFFYFSSLQVFCSYIGVLIRFYKSALPSKLEIYEQKKETGDRYDYQRIR